MNLMIFECFDKFLNTSNNAANLLKILNQRVQLKYEVKCRIFSCLRFGNRGFHRNLTDFDLCPVKRSFGHGSNCHTLDACSVGHVVRRVSIAGQTQGDCGRGLEWQCLFEYALDLDPSADENFAIGPDTGQAVGFDPTNNLLCHRAPEESVRCPDEVTIFSHQGCHLCSSLVSQSGVCELFPVGQDKGQSLGPGVNGTDAPDFQHGVNNNLSIRLQGGVVVFLVLVEQLSQVVTQLVIVRVIVIPFVVTVLVMVGVMVLVMVLGVIVIFVIVIVTLMMVEVISVVVLMIAVLVIRVVILFVILVMVMIIVTMLVVVMVIFVTIGQSSSTAVGHQA